mmetsp:Transcript_28645/g.54836  ORF Transcript_28645/g.54836 Transcript_28645/m.54836 type:complete len:210 (+) Transcript_28645:1534-2163(+)
MEGRASQVGLLPQVHPAQRARFISALPRARPVPLESAGALALPRLRRLHRHRRQDPASEQPHVPPPGPQRLRLAIGQPPADSALAVRRQLLGQDELGWGGVLQRHQAAHVHHQKQRSPRLPQPLRQQATRQRRRGGGGCAGSRDAHPLAHNRAHEGDGKRPQHAEHARPRQHPSLRTLASEPGGESGWPRGHCRALEAQRTHHQPLAAG